MSRFSGEGFGRVDRQPQTLQVEEDPAQWSSIQDAIAYLKVKDIAFLRSLGGRLGARATRPEDIIAYAVRLLEAQDSKPIQTIESQLKRFFVEQAKLRKSLASLEEQLQSEPQPGSVEGGRYGSNRYQKLFPQYREKTRDLEALLPRIAVMQRLVELLQQPLVEEESQDVQVVSDEQLAEAEPPEVIEEVLEITDEASQDAGAEATNPEEQGVVEQEPEKTIAIFPPDERLPQGEGTGEASGSGEPQPRNKVLEQHFAAVGIAYELIHGCVEEGWRRQEPYNAYLLPELGRIVVVCDAYGAASFVFHEWDGTRGQAEQLLQMTKGEIQESGLPISRIIFPGNMMTWLELVDKKLALNPNEVTVSTSRDFSPVRVANELQELGLKVNRRLVSKLAKLLEGSYLESSQALDFEEYVATTIAECVQPVEGWMSVKEVFGEAKAIMKARGREDTLDYGTVVRRLLAVIEEAPEEQEGMRRFISRGLSPREANSVRLESIAYIPEGLPEDIQRKMRTYVSLELAEAVIEELVENTKRVGWKTANAIAQHFEKKMGPRINLHMQVRETAERLLAEGGKFASQEVRHSDQKVIQYNPELVSAILQELELLDNEH